MREGRQAQCGDDGDALVVDVDLVDAAFITIDRALDQSGDILGMLELGAVETIRRVKMREHLAILAQIVR
jgi:hypothetical protein